MDFDSPFKALHIHAFDLAYPSWICVQCTSSQRCSCEKKECSITTQSILKHSEYPSRANHEQGDTRCDRIFHALFTITQWTSIFYWSEIRQPILKYALEGNIVLCVAAISRSVRVPLWWSITVCLMIASMGMCVVYTDCTDNTASSFRHLSEADSRCVMCVSCIVYLMLICPEETDSICVIPNPRISFKKADVW
jgi:hypothetical protein